jgi:hypothetical protein
VHVEKSDQIPAVAAEIVAIDVVHHRIQPDSRRRAVLLRLRYGDVG